MAAKGSKGGGRSGGYASTEDALAVGVARIVHWMRGHQRAVILGVLVAIALAAGLIYYRDYRKNLTARAATQLEQLEAELAQSNAPASAVGRLRDFLNRFGGTPSADDARLLMARIQLDQGAPADAVKTLDPLSGRALDTPIGYAATRLRADAYAAAGDRDSAIGTLDDAARNARFPFQRNDASAELADLLVQAGRYDSAASIYRRLTQDSAASPEGTGVYAMRLGEVLALKTVGAPPPAGPPADTTGRDTRLPPGLGGPTVSPTLPVAPAGSAAARAGSTSNGRSGGS
ncbi:MAG: tetratricopeptide repeat protein [Candidatus Palauibacterales bacterium]|nr:tetratricopeptide repeat protein [Candidatus Palauibacterales bacterium]MDP2529385.1 tetratricopeptide repeat protein [Candidatus Palauibacterales bacterium]MDP2583208.1 tetratricopeptide repeat protein [Candidatus Palauibacterales bacterium]